jgi:hypothetical protein
MARPSHDSAPPPSRSQWLTRASSVITRVTDASAKAVVRHPSTRAEAILAAVWLAGLFAFGGWVWVYFLNGGAIQLDLHDWGEVTSPRYAFLKDAVTQGVLPLHMPGEWALRNVTDRFIAVADTNISPQIILLRWMTLGGFFVANTVGLYALGCAGLAWLFRRFRLSPIVTTALFFLLFFNGHIAAHIAVGHANWAAFFLLPFFGLLVFDALETSPGWRWTLGMAMLLFVIFLQGAFHLFVIGLLFLGLLGLTTRRLLRPAFLAMVFSVLLSAVRILPPLLEASNFDTEFRSGFTSVFDMIGAFVLLKVPVVEQVFSQNPINPLGWWELDYYIGFLGLAFVGGLGLLAFLRPPQGRPDIRPLLFPILAMTVLSICKLYKIFHVLHIPMLDSQRVSSRLLYLPLLILTLAAALWLQDWLNRKQPTPLLSASMLAGTLVLASDIWAHTKLWRVAKMGELFPNKVLDLGLNVVANHPDPAYTATLIAGGVISLASLICLVALAIRERRIRRPTDR